MIRVKYKTGAKDSFRNDIICSGVVRDKYRGYSSINNQLLDGNNKTRRVAQQIPVDFFIVETDSGIDHVECSNIIEYKKIGY